MWRKSKLVALAGLLVVAGTVTASQAHAQYYNYYGYYAHYSPRPATAKQRRPAASDSLRGAAAAMDAYSNNLVATQNARIRYEQWQQARLETRRQEYEFEMWKRANTPSLSDQQESYRREQVRQAQNAPGTE